MSSLTHQVSPPFVVVLLPTQPHHLLKKGNKMIDKHIIQKQILEHLKEAPLGPDQESWLSEFHSSERVVHLTGKRASGRSSFGVGLISTSMLLNVDQHFAIFVNSAGDANFKLARVKEYLERSTAFITQLFGFKLEYPIIRANKSEVILNNNSRVFVISNPNRLRGMTLNGAFIDLWNTRTMEDLNQDLLASILPCLFPPAKLMISLGE